MVMHDKALKSPDMKSLVTKLQGAKLLAKNAAVYAPESAKNLPLLVLRYSGGFRADRSVQSGRRNRETGGCAYDKPVGVCGFDELKIGSVDVRILRYGFSPKWTAQVLRFRQYP